MPVTSSNQNTQLAERSALRNTPAGSPPPTGTRLPENPPGPTSVGDPAANSFRAHGDSATRQRLLGNPRRSTRASTSSPAPTQNAETSAPLQETAALGPTSEAAQPPTPAANNPTANDDGTTASTPSTDLDPAMTAADVQKIKDQLAQRNNKKLSLGSNLSDSTRNELMTQLGGRKNMDYEGIEQADRASKEMAKQSEKWGHV